MEIACQFYINFLIAESFFCFVFFFEATILISNANIKTFYLNDFLPKMWKYEKQIYLPITQSVLENKSSLIYLPSNFFDC